jgi:hypothetical protein
MAQAVRRRPSLRRPGFALRSVHVVEKVALGTSQEFFGFLLLVRIPPLLHNHLSPPHDVCDSPDQAAYYHALGPKLVASSLTRHFIDLGVKLHYSIL